MSDEHDDIDIELGFIVDDCEPPLEQDVTEWDGGYVGGRPLWVLPDRLPPLEILQCPRCDGVMPLLVQLFAPVDADPSCDGALPSPEASHVRMLYIFACPQEACVNRASSTAVESHMTPHLSQPSVRLLRAQHGPSTRSVSMSAASARACSVCGLPAAFRCSRCGRARYCCRQHQAWHWRHGHKDACGTDAVGADHPDAEDAAAAALLFPPHELSVDMEPTSTLRASMAADAMTPAARAAVHAVMSGVPSTAAAEAGDAEATASIADLTQSKLAEMTGRELQADSAMQYFLRRTACKPSQVLRYCRWPARTDPVPYNKSAAAEAPDATAAPPSGGDAFEDEDEHDVDAEQEPVGVPLWVSAKHCPPHDAARQPRIPHCENCGAPRAFECQLLPQLIAEVTPKAALAAWTADGSTAASAAARITIDFGTMLVYTCTASCSPRSDAPSAYLREFVWVQPMESVAPIMTRVLQEEEAAAGAEADGGTDEPERGDA